MKKKEIRARCWIEIDGIKHFGPGPAELLDLVHESGSISNAAGAMGMSYKKAWEIVSRMNSRGQRPYVILRKGGKRGGGAELTATGKKVLQSFKKLNRKVQSVIRKETEILLWI